MTSDPQWSTEPLPTLHYIYMVMVFNHLFRNCIKKQHQQLHPLAQSHLSQILYKKPCFNSRTKNNMRTGGVFLQSPGFAVPPLTLPTVCVSILFFQVFPAGRRPLFLQLFRFLLSGVPAAPPGTAVTQRVHSVNSDGFFLNEGGFVHGALGAQTFEKT